MLEGTSARTHRDVESTHTNNCLLPSSDQQTGGWEESLDEWGRRDGGNNYIPLRRQPPHCLKKVVYTSNCEATFE